MGTESLSERQRAESESARFDQAADLVLVALAAKRKNSRAPLHVASLMESSISPLSQADGPLLEGQQQTQSGSATDNKSQRSVSVKPHQAGQASTDLSPDSLTPSGKSSLTATSIKARGGATEKSACPSLPSDEVTTGSQSTPFLAASQAEAIPPVVQIPAVSVRATSSPHSTMEEYRSILLGGQARFSPQQVADQTGSSMELVQEFWGAMGFQPVQSDQVAFTSRDMESFTAWAHLIESGAVDLATARSLAQAQSHLADRLALWQVEALVEDASRRLDLDDTAARLVALDHMREYLDVLQDTMVYAWQRQLENLLTRVDRDVSQRGHEEARRRFPLTRSLGFADMVSFTESSAIMGDKMVALIERFEDVCRTAVAASGGRVVKMIGDAVFFVADDLGTGLRLVTTLLDYLQADPQILPVRASFVRGDVFSRSGDMFGPTVNLAARLVDVAPVGRILTDASTAAAIAAGKGGSGYRLENFPSADLRGFGRVSPYLLSRAQEEKRR